MLTSCVICVDYFKTTVSLYIYYCLNFIVCQNFVNNYIHLDFLEPTQLINNRLKSLLSKIVNYFQLGCDFDVGLFVRSKSIFYIWKEMMLINLSRRDVLRIVDRIFPVNKQARTLRLKCTSTKHHPNRQTTACTYKQGFVCWNTQRRVCADDPANRK